MLLDVRCCFRMLFNVRHCFRMLFNVRHCFRMLFNVRHCFRMLLDVRHCFRMLFNVRHCFRMLFNVRHCFRMLLDVRCCFRMLFNVRHRRAFGLRRDFTTQCCHSDRHALFVRRCERRSTTQTTQESAFIDSQDATSGSLRFGGNGGTDQPRVVGETSELAPLFDITFGTTQGRLPGGCKSQRGKLTGCQSHGRGASQFKAGTRRILGVQGQKSTSHPQNGLTIRHATQNHASPPSEIGFILRGRTLNLKVHDPGRNFFELLGRKLRRMLFDPLHDPAFGGTEILDDRQPSLLRQLDISCRTPRLLERHAEITRFRVMRFTPVTRNLTSSHRGCRLPLGIPSRSLAHFMLLGLRLQACAMLRQLGHRMF